MTLDEFCALRIEEPTELVRGNLIVRHFPYVSHGIVCANICYLLANWHREHRNGTPVALHGVITNRNPDSLRSIDAAYYGKDRLSLGKLDHYPTTPPQIACEVRSHDETWLDLTIKMGEFIAAGTDVFIIVDPFVETVHVFDRKGRTSVPSIKDELIIESL
jgi:Uma2 family endonuclease